MSQAPVAPPGGDVSQGPTILASTWALTTISLITCACRLYGRLKMTRNAGRDDVVILVSMLVALLYSILITVAISDGYGRHLYYLAENAAPAIKISLVAFIFGIVSVGIPKLAVTCLLIRLLNPTRRHVIILYSLSISCIVIVSLCAVFLWTQCHPVAALWDPSLVPICWNPTILVTYSILAGVYSGCIDLYLAVWPMYVLYGLKINREKKLGLCFVLGLGICSAVMPRFFPSQSTNFQCPQTDPPFSTPSATVAAFYKCSRLPELYDVADYTYASGGLSVWSSVEPNIMIIAANLPTLRPIFLAVTRRPGTTNSKSAAMQGSYKLHSVGRNSKNVSGHGGAKEVYPTDTVNLVHPGEEEGGVYLNSSTRGGGGGITRTMSTTVTSEDWNDRHHSGGDLEKGSTAGEKKTWERW
ncbi:hypothetical protein MMC32_005426 [Xylographa parallela]|nr:hypothetical protein [Xylographa parallela]